MRDNEIRYSTIVGGVLRFFRESAGLSQNQMSVSFNSCQSAWSKIERGTAAITVEKLIHASSKLGVSPGDILHISDRILEEINSCRILSKKIKETGFVLNEVSFPQISKNAKGLLPARFKL